MNSGHDFDLVAFGAHPDDVELFAGGTLAKSVAQGLRVAIVDLTRGELGTRGTAETRKAEAAAAQAILGVQHRENLDLGDGFFEVSEETLRAVIEVLRRLRPLRVIANALSDRHPSARISLPGPNSANALRPACTGTEHRTLSHGAEGT